MFKSPMLAKVVFGVWLSFHTSEFLVLICATYVYKTFGMRLSSYASTIVLLSIALFGVWMAQKRVPKGSTADRSKPNNVPSKLFVFATGVLILASLFALFGAGIYGSPFDSAFEFRVVDPFHRGKFENTPYNWYSVDSYWSFNTWQLLAVTAGPMGMLPWLCLESQRRRWGAVGLIITSVFALVIANSVGAFSNPIHARDFAIGLALCFGPSFLAGCSLLLPRVKA